MFEQFAWQLFSLTGNIDGYLLYKDIAFQDDLENDEETNDKQS